MSHLLGRLNFFAKKNVDKFSDGHLVTTNESRTWEDAYRNRWQDDTIVRSTHGVNCTRACWRKIFVKGGIVTWEPQQTDYPRTHPDLPNHEPRGCAPGTSCFRYMYSANTVKRPLVRSCLIRHWREARVLHSPVATWVSIVENKDKRAKRRRETAEDAKIRARLEQEVKTPKADSLSWQRYCDNSPARFTADTVFEARHILVMAPVEDGPGREEAKVTTQSLIDELTQDPSKFTYLAQEFSACPSTARGGNLGQLTSGSTDPEFETVLGELEEGQLWPSPVPTRFGCHVIHLDRVIAGSRLPFEVVRDKIAAYLKASSWSRAVSQYIGLLSGQADTSGIDIGGSNSPLVQ